MPRTVRPRRQRPDNQANIAILNERIATLEAELCAEQRRSAYDRADFDRERSPTGSGNTPIVELGALRTLLEEVSRPAVERPRRWWRHFVEPGNIKRAWRWIARFRC
jgi:hypothetical protein